MPQDIFQITGEELSELNLAVYRYRRIYRLAQGYSDNRILGQMVRDAIEGWKDEDNRLRQGTDLSGSGS